MMEFYEVLDQVIDLLQRHGRVSYRALKRQFSVDDDFLADLVDELVEIQQIATDQDGRMLVLAGERGIASASSTPETDKHFKAAFLPRAAASPVPAAGLL